MSFETTETLIDYSALGVIRDQLKIALRYADDKELLQLPDNEVLYGLATIYAFNNTYDLSISYIKRYLYENMPAPNSMHTYTFNELLREAYAIGLVQGEVSVWRRFRDQRNITSYAYDVRKAQNVFEMVPAFIEEVDFLYAQLIKQTDDVN